MRSNKPIGRLKMERCGNRLGYHDAERINRESRWIIRSSVIIDAKQLTKRYGGEEFQLPIFNVAKHA